MGQRLAKPRTAGLLLSGATRSMAELAACEPFYAAPSGGTTAASYAHQAHAPAGFHEYTLVAKRDAGRDSKLLTFALPETMPTLGASVISGVKVKQEVAGEELDKSYSPTSPAERTETFDLLVKAYTPRKGGGLGAWLCALEPGQNASMKVKGAKKIVNGAPLARNRFRRIGMLAGGTGVAPFMHLVATLLADPEDATLLDLVVSHREPQDALLDAELAALAAASAGRLRVHHTFSRVTEPAAPPAAARSTGGTVFASTGAGRIDDALARAMLPSPSEDDVFILVCGTDGFVGDMAGPIERVYDAAGKKSKVQGPTLGVLGRLGFRPEQVFKL